MRMVEIGFMGRLPHDLMDKISEYADNYAFQSVNRKDLRENFIGLVDKVEDNIHQR